jgi:hypothetical protein
MTQRLAVENILANIDKPTKGQLGELELLLEQSENKKGDGSINGVAWLALRDAVQAWRTAQAKVKTFRKELS